MMLNIPSGKDLLSWETTRLTTIAVYYETPNRFLTMPSHQVYTLVHN
ncbi:hypothetical protein ACR6HW_12265 [Fusibacter sp. JL298sf-3]